MARHADGRSGASRTLATYRRKPELLSQAFDERLGQAQRALVEPPSDPVHGPLAFLLRDEVGKRGSDGVLVRGKLQGVALLGLALEELTELLRCRLAAMLPQEVLDNAFPQRLDKGLLSGRRPPHLVVQFLQ